MSLRSFAEVLRSRWLSILVLVVICGGVVGAMSVSATPQYRSTAKVYFSITNGATANDLSQGSAYTQNLVVTYAALATTPLVLDPVINALDLKTTSARLGSSVSASVTPNTVLVGVSVSDPSPVRAANIANAVANQLGNEVQKLAPKDAKGMTILNVTTIAQATPARAPFSPKTKRNVISAVVGGLLLGIVYAMLREAWVTQVRRRRGIDAITNAPVVGEITDSSSFMSDLPEPRGARSPNATELFKDINRALEFLAVDRSPFSVVVTSAVSREGTTAVVLNLAVASAEAGSRTLVMDANLRAPEVGAQLRRPDAEGLSSILVGRCRFGDAVVPLGPKLDVLPAGPKPPNPSFLLASQAMERLLEEVTPSYDVILIGSAPVLSSGDTVSLLPAVSGVLLVTHVRRRLFGRRSRHNRLGGARIREAVEIVQEGGSVLGVVLNGVPERQIPTGSDASMAERHKAR